MSLTQLRDAAFEQGRLAAGDPFDPARPGGPRPVSGNPGPVSLTRVLKHRLDADDLTPSAEEMAVVADGFDAGVRAACSGT